MERAAIMPTLRRETRSTPSSPPSLLESQVCSAWTSSVSAACRTECHPGEIDMPQFPNSQIVKKVKKLSEIAEELRQGKDFPATRLTTIKSLCGEPEAAAAFMVVKRVAGKSFPWRSSSA